MQREIRQISRKQIIFIYVEKTMQNKYTVSLEPDKFYHIYNRGNNGDNIFCQTRNYAFFLKKYDDYFADFVKTHAFCLLPNHFHVLVEIKSENEILNAINNKIKHQKLCKYVKNLPDSRNRLSAKHICSEDITERNPADSVNDLSIALSKQFGEFFISWSKSINKQENRRGSLFEKPFKRKLVDSDKYYRECMCYIHRNPLHHNLREDFMNYSWSSYLMIMEPKESNLPKKYILDKFGDLGNYHFVHQKEQNLDNLKDIIID